MKYIGKLYGKIGRRTIPLKLTSEDVDRIVSERNEAIELLRRCEYWISTIPEGRAMQIECQKLLIKSNHEKK